VLSSDVIDVVYKAISALTLRKPEQPKEVPAVPEDADEATTTRVQEEAEQIKAYNESLEKTNAKLAHLQ
jgi:hypothetical protein